MICFFVSYARADVMDEMSSETILKNGTEEVPAKHHISSGVVHIHCVIFLFSML